MRVHAGDVAGDAADELVVHMEFLPTGGHGGDHMVGQRVHHFDVTRNAAGAITSVELARPQGAEPWVDYDFSHIVRTMEPISGNWDAAVANINDTMHAEILFAHNRNESDVDNLYLHAYRVSYHLTAAFKYHQTGLDVQFQEISVGGGNGPFPAAQGSPRWTFGDGASSGEINPVHTFAGDGDYTVNLNISENWNGNSSSSTAEVTIEVREKQPSQGSSIVRENYRYQIQVLPAYTAMIAGDGIRRFDMVSIDVDDMDRDGIGEIFTIARRGGSHETGAGMLYALWGLDYNSANPVLVSDHRFEPSTSNLPNNSIRAMRAVAADVDGDSVHATIGADCRQVDETQGRTLIWVPPHFQHLQSGASRSASIGESSGTTDSVEHQYGTFTSHDVSAYVGASLGIEAIGLGASIKATAGRNSQSALGSIVGTENTFELSEAHTQESGDALLLAETNRFKCYTYDLGQASTGIDEDSSMRICERLVVNNVSAIMEAVDPQYWDSDMLLNWAQGSGGHPPPAWAPFTRDWANLALFRPVSSNAVFTAGSSASAATDGRFTTRVESQPRTQPYIEIDLGRVKDITNIRVFPVHRELASDFRGYRVYTSTEPMPTSGVPSGSDIRVFAPEAAHDMVFDRWNIWTRHWNASVPGTQPGDPMKARYIRLQHPGADPVKLNLGQIQVFGDVHVDPPFYPDAVCDDNKADDLFRAKVWDAGVERFRDVEVRGLMLWSGSNVSGQVWGNDSNFLQACTNYAGMPKRDIWSGQTIGGTGTLSWNIYQGTGSLTGSVTSLENSIRAGAEFELTVGTPFLALQTGGAYEYTSGVTEEHSSTSYWGHGLDLGGGMAGFTPASANGECRYNARPYGYTLTERSNTGYQHTLLVVDYTVTDDFPTAWTRGDLPAACQSPEGDRIFGNGFEAD